MPSILKRDTLQPNVQRELQKIPSFSVPSFCVDAAVDVSMHERHGYSGQGFGCKGVDAAVDVSMHERHGYPGQGFGCKGLVGGQDPVCRRGRHCTVPGCRRERRQVQAARQRSRLFCSCTRTVHLVTSVSSSTCLWR